MAHYIPLLASLISKKKRFICLWGRFIVKGALTKHLMKGGGGSKKAEDHLTSYTDDPYIYFYFQLPQSRALKRGINLISISAVLKIMDG